MVETKIIILDQQEIVYKIHYKRIKNCYLRVEKGEVVIRCSPLFPQSEIEKLIRNHQEEILEQIKGYVPKYNYQEDGYVYLFNQKYQIILKDMNIKKNYSKKRHQSYASVQAHAVINGLIGVIVIAFISFYFFLTPLNPQSIAFWLTLIIALFVFAALKSLSICSAAAVKELLNTKSSGNVCSLAASLIEIALFCS